MNKLFRLHWAICITAAVIISYLLPADSYGTYLIPVKIKIVADQNLANEKNWRGMIEKELEKAATPLAEILGIKISIVDYEIWNREPGKNFLHSSWRMIEEVNRGKADAVIGFCLLPESSGRTHLRTDGMTIAYRGMLLKMYRGDSRNNHWLTHIIVHEMVHLFGGVHVYDGSIMSPQFDGDVKMELDPLNKKIVTLTRNIDFKTGYASLERIQLMKLAGLYQKAVRQGNQEIPTLLELGGISRQLGELGQAKDAFRQIVEIDPSLVHAWVQLAFCFYEDKQPDITIAVLEKALRNVIEKDLLYSKLAALYYNRGDYQKSYNNALMAEYHGAIIDNSLWEGLKKAGVDEAR